MATTSPPLSQIIKEARALVKDGNDFDTRILEAQHEVEKAELPSTTRAKDNRDAFVELLWRSRRIATSAKGAADDLRGDMLNLVLMEDVGVQEKINELNNWSKGVEHNAEAARGQPDQFLRFADRLNDYASALEKEISDARQDDARRQAASNPKPKRVEEDNGGGCCGKRRKNPVPKPDPTPNPDPPRPPRYDASAVPGNLRDIADNIEEFVPRLSFFTNGYDQLEDEKTKVVEFLNKGIPTTDSSFRPIVQHLKDAMGTVSKVMGIYANASLSD